MLYPLSYEGLARPATAVLEPTGAALGRCRARHWLTLSGVFHGSRQPPGHERCFPNAEGRLHALKIAAPGTTNQGVRSRLVASAPPASSDQKPQWCKSLFIVLTCAWSLLNPISGKCQASSSVRSNE